MRERGVNTVHVKCMHNYFPILRCMHAHRHTVEQDRYNYSNVNCTQVIYIQWNKIDLCAYIVMLTFPILYIQWNKIDLCTYNL